MKLLNLALAVVAVALLVPAVRRRAWLAVLAALVVAALCLWTVPIVM